MRLLKILTVVAFVLVIVLLFHNGPKQLAPAYNPATEAKAEGIIADVQQYWCPINGDEGTHFILKTSTGTVEVHVAPRRFLDGNGVSFNKGDQVSVVGSMVDYQGHESMIARKVTRGDQTFAVRQPNGRPLWVEPVHSYVR